MSRTLALLAALSAAPLAAQDAVVATDQGSFVIRLLPDRAPAHVKLFLETAKSGGYSRTTFHRIVPGGLIQGGDPLSRDKTASARYGQGGLGLLKAEFSDRPFARGSVGAVRRPSSRDSAGTQFFVCVVDQPSLTGQYTLFGEVVEGMEVVDKIAATPVNGDKALSRIEIQSVSVRAAASPAP